MEVFAIPIFISDQWSVSSSRTCFGIPMLKRFLSKELFYPFQLAEYVIYGILKQVQN